MDLALFYDAKKGEIEMLDDGQTVLTHLVLENERRLLEAQLNEAVNQNADFWNKIKATYIELYLYLESKNKIPVMYKQSTGNPSIVEMNFVRPFLGS